jgi:2-polyprenyl-3-methyl-5-hydroxy-6-metoxy-1,4-benzoquinol methylase
MDSNFWNNRYTQEVGLYGNEPNQYFKEKIRDLAPGRLLIPGEGEGRQALFAAGRGWQVTAFDMSEVARSHALDKAKHSGLNITYLLSKAEDFEYRQEVYDAAALIYFHLPDNIRNEVHKKITASVKPGGHLIVEAFHPEQLSYSSGGPKSEEMLYTTEMLTRDFEGWEILEKLEGEVLLQEGSGHAGPGYVSRLFARKSL